jgi:uncharacterized iron-regulated membrane protein
MKTKNCISMSVFIALALALFFGITTSSAADQAEVSQARHGVIAADKKSGILKYDPDGNVIWSFNAAPVHRIQQLANGNILAQRGRRELVEVSPKGKVVWQYDAGPDNPQLIEVSRNKQVVWTFKDFKNLGNDTAASASATVGVRGKAIR